MITIDGTLGEGGGQVLRSSLALAAITGQDVRLFNIRAGRNKGGLLRQHLTCVQAAAALCGAEVEGAGLRATEIVFRPGPIRAGAYHFSVGSAGSAALVLQTVLPILLFADDVSTVRIEGGTHAMWAPPWPFLEHSFVPALSRMGVNLDLRCEVPGFYPAGGGVLLATVAPGRPEPLELIHRGEVAVDAHAIVSALAPRIGWTELRTMRDALGLGRHDPPLEVERPVGPGNACWITASFDGGACVFSAFGRRGVRAQAVAREAVDAFQAWELANVPVCEHLADQLLLPIALAGSGRFRTTEPSLHTTTNAEVIAAFTGQRFTFSRGAAHDWEVALER